MIPSAPVGPASWVCLLLSVLACVPIINRWLARRIFESSKRGYIASVTGLCFVLSVAYVHGYLGGQPRIIDATSYLLQAKTFATGQFAFAPQSALHSFAGRFLVITPSGHLAVLFPPGFAALLSLGVALGVPLLVNPLVGALLAFLTYRLGAQWFSEQVGRIAGVLSALCACLRYHSADTMSHAWAAALGLGVLIFATAEHKVRRWAAVVAGGCAGWLFATRPVTGVVLGGAGLALVWAHATPGTRLKRVFGYVLGATPGLALWWTYQWVTTGSAWDTTQTTYYARSDWPFGCFRLGLDQTIGCRFEHRDFLERYQPRGFGPLQALEVTLRRLWLHQRDITNVPFLAFCLFFAVRRNSLAAGRARLLLSLVALHVVSYAFFYFDGNYPGGGARLLVDVLPLEQVLLGVVFTRAHVARFVPSACCFGFALWGAVEHRALARREGGRPMFEPSVLHDAGIKDGLVFVQTDHGFNLGFDPAASPDTNDARLFVARLRNDGFDAATWRAFGQPPAYIYRFDATFESPARVALEPYEPANTLSFAGRSLWPAVAVGGSTIPVHNPDGLRLIPHAEQTLEVTLELPVSQDDQFQLAIEVDVSSPSTLEVRGWERVAERRLDNTLVLTFGPKLLSAGKTAVALRSRIETTVERLTLLPASKPRELSVQTP